MILDDQSADRLPRADLPRGAAGRAAAVRADAAGPVRARLRRRVPGHRPQPGAAAAGPRRRRSRPDRGGRPATSRSTPSAGAEVRGILDFPRGVPARRRHARADVVALRRHPPVRAPAAAAVPGGRRPGWPPPARSTPRRFAAFRAPDAQAGPFGAGRVDVLTFDTERAETEHVADLLRRAHLEDGVAVVRDGGAGPLRARHHPARCAGPWAPPASRSRWPATRSRWSREPAVLPLLDALRAVVDLDNEDPADVDHFGADRAEALLAPRWAASTRPTCGRWPGRCAPGEAGRPRRRRGLPAARPPRAGPPGRCSTPPARRARRRERPRSPRRGRWPAAAPARGARRGAHRRGGAVAAVVRHRLAAPAAPRRRPRRPGGAAGAPRPRRDLCALRGRGPGRGAARPHQRA